MMVTQDEIEAAIVAVGEAISNGDNASEIALAALSAADRTTPMTDIDALAKEIVRLHEDIDSGADIPAHVYKMARDVLSRLTTPPLPEEIADTIERLGLAASGLDHKEPRKTLYWKAMEALRALAQENERLLQSLNMSHELVLQARIAELEAEGTRQLTMRRDADELADAHRERAEQAEARIAELEAERGAVVKDSIKAALAWKAESDARCDAACDAIRAKTFEECASKVRDLKFEGASPSWNDAIDGAIETIEDIRALAQTDEHPQGD